MRNPIPEFPGKGRLIYRTTEVTDGKGRMYGYHTIPFTLEQEEMSISVAREGGGLRYLRRCGAEQVEMTLLVEEARLLLCPVEPLHKPKALSSHLLVKFERALMAAPKASHTVFLTFPVEIGVHVEGNGSMELLEDQERPGSRRHRDPVSAADALVCQRTQKR